MFAVEMALISKLRWVVKVGMALWHNGQAKVGDGLSIHAMHIEQHGR